MPFENGVNWQPVDPDKRGRHATIQSALDAALESMVVHCRDEFLDSLVDRWPTLFPKLAAKPGRFENGILFLYVRSAPVLFSLRPRLRMIREKLLALPDAPRRLEVRLEIHT